MPISQGNSAKIITALKELFTIYGILEVIWSDNRPQFASHLCAEFVKDWNIKHSISSPRNPRSHGQAGAMGKQDLWSRLLKDCLPVPSVLDRIPTSLS